MLLAVDAALLDAAALELVANKAVWRAAAFGHAVDRALVCLAGKGHSCSKAPFRCKLCLAKFGRRVADHAKECPVEISRSIAVEDVVLFLCNLMELGNARAFLECGNRLIE